MPDQKTRNSSAKRRTRVALMGEFSSGKSTLSNLLLGEEPLPMKVTATRLPPVLITYGAPATFVVARNGTEQEIETDKILSNCFDEAAMIRLQREADILQICDLIDTPGISDPNMSMDTWRPIVEDIDCIIWCTHATQAWRQSEAAMWEQISTASHGHNLLLVTQFDKLRTELEGKRVLNRLQSQTSGQFKKIFPVSLLKAIEASDDFTIWQDSGAASFVEYLVPHLLSIENGRVLQQSGIGRHAASSAPEMIVEHVAEIVEQAPMTVHQSNISSQNHTNDVVRPRRVRIKTRIKPSTKRPETNSMDREKIVLASLRDPLERSAEPGVYDQESLDATG